MAKWQWLGCQCATLSMSTTAIHIHATHAMPTSTPPATTTSMNDHWGLEMHMRLEPWVCFLLFICFIYGHF